MVKYLLAAVGFGVLHLLVCMAVVAATFGEAMSNWDTPSSPSLGYHVSQGFLDVLGFPGLTMVKAGNLWTTPIGQWFFYGNSFLWGLAIVTVDRVVSRRRAARLSAVQPHKGIVRAAD